MSTANIKQELQENPSSSQSQPSNLNETDNKNFAIQQETNQTAVAKKRGRKKKSEIASPQDTTINDVLTSTRPQRGKRVDYAAVMNDSDDVKATPSRQRKRKISYVVEEIMDHDADDEYERNRKQRNVLNVEMMNQIFACINSSATSEASGSIYDNLIQIPEDPVPPPPPPEPPKPKR